jgi:hypothetical protein
MSPKIFIEREKRNLKKNCVFLEGPIIGDIGRYFQLPVTVVPPCDPRAALLWSTMKWLGSGNFIIENRCSVEILAGN